MTWILGITLALLITAGLTALAVLACAWWMRHVARRVGLLDHQPSQKPIRGYLWLADREMEQWMNNRKREGSE